MRLIEQIPVVDSKLKRYTVSSWCGMDCRATVTGLEFVPGVTHYKLNDSIPVERIDNNTFMTEGGAILKRAELVVDN